MSGRLGRCTPLFWVCFVDVVSVNVGSRSPHGNRASFDNLASLQKRNE